MSAALSKLEKGDVLRLLLLGTAFAAAVFLSLDFYLKMRGSEGLCSVQACRVAGGYLRYGEKFLIAFGAGFFWLLWMAVFFAGRYPKPWLKHAVLLLLFCAAAFDGGLMGFQVFGVNEKCPLCLWVAAGIFLILLIYSLAEKKAGYLLLGLGVWTASAGVQEMLLLPQRTPPIEETSFYDYAKKPDSKYPSYYFFFSLQCDGCAHVLYKLAESSGVSGNWHFSCVDLTEEDMASLNGFEKAELTAKNPFLSVLKVKFSQQKTKQKADPKIAAANKKAGTYILNTGNSNIPALVVMDYWDKTIHLQGLNTILDFLVARGQIAPFRSGD